MSIEIIGSNGSKLKLITKDKIDSIISEKKITYDLYKNKYLSSDNNIKCQLTKNHFLIQIITTFYKYDNTQSFDYNLYKFKHFLQNVSNTSNLMEYINIFMIQNKLYNKLNSSIETIIKQLYPSTELIELNNNYYLDLLMLIELLSDSKVNNSKLEKLKVSIKNLENYISEISIININNHNTTNNDLSECQMLIYNLDLYFKNIDSIKGNILKIDSLLNIIIENIYKFY